MKICARCKVEKTVDSFGSAQRNKDGLNSWCRPCHSEYQATYRRKKPRPPNDSAKQRASALRINYHLTVEQYEDLLSSQDSKCAVCREEYVAGGRNFHIDHDHSCCPGKRSCGKCIRGILCHGCNMALGFVKDSADTLQSLINYLNR